MYLVPLLCFIMLYRAVAFIRTSNEAIGRRRASITRSAVRTMGIYYNDVYEVILPAKHRFPMHKYRMTRELLQHELQDTNGVQFHVSPHATADELSLTHSPAYVHRYLSGQLTDAEVRKTGFPWTPANVARSTSSTGGTVAAMRSVMSKENTNVACHVAGGTHHAFYDYGEGFCIFSDIAVASNLALKEYDQQVKQILIVDLDVHQGNGNAVLFQNEPRVFTFSMHCKDNYFSRKEHSNVDVELEPGTQDEEYLAQLNLWWPRLLDSVQPDLVFYQAGVDIFEGDRLGKLKVTRRGLQRRNAAIYREIMQRNLKCVVTMGGGYPKDLVTASSSFQGIVQCHADVYRSCVAYNLGIDHQQDGL